MATTGERVDPYLGYGFRVEVGGLVVGGFTEVTGLQVETVVETYREGGVNEYEHKLPGPARYPANLVLRNGISDVEALWQWHQDVLGGVFERRDGTVYLLDGAGEDVMWWHFLQALPVRWTGPELRAASGTVAVEAVELVHQGLRKARAGGAG
ncbi:phage tail-like protein [Actinoplanes octamycinicus]|uniref:Phage tail-like protein n=1 Tax=Actinoplanes octamycinicus TaxID=135948 RepID=A0A7W7MBF7_9ACTN|nr:phage tail protein [Actinoplanes octamycinicus]MBB4744079.1 phage tail-like protein [Actinoplanes octamycinicus]GIE56964.1 phage tail protein [Actinoplanes octamycinicus]